MNSLPEISTSRSAAVLWLEGLARQAAANRLAHFDLLLDATGLPTPLPPAPAEQPSARLFDGTPEQTLAEQGPHLRRFRLDDPRQLDAARNLAASLDCARLLALLSPWRFDALAAHLRHCSQAHWGRAGHGGLLRYYDPRLFQLCSDMLLPAQAEWFHAPAIAWHWRDGAGQPHELAGRPCRQEELAAPLPALQLNDGQLFELLAWSEAVWFCERQALASASLGFASETALHRHIVHGLAAARRERIDEAGREDFLLGWLERQKSGTSV